MHSSIAGRYVRVRISNAYGKSALIVGHASIARSSSPGSGTAEHGSIRALRFDGRGAVTIPAGGSVLSDPMPFTVPADSDLLLSTFTPRQPPIFSYHFRAQQRSFYAPGGDRTTDPNGADFPDITGSWFLVTGLSVSGTSVPGAVVTLGDSITDGFRSTLGADHRWPDVLADRLAAGPLREDRGVINSGIAGNRLLRPGGYKHGVAALGRFNRDVLSQPGVRDLIVLEGINDIQALPHQYDPAKIETALSRLAVRAHARGLRIIVGTLTPYQGWPSYQPEGEKTRQAVNWWIRHSTRFDGVVDFDASVRDPSDAHRIAPRYDSGDHLHPNDAGYAAMANAVDLDRL